jgi:hypothetical protein
MRLLRPLTNTDKAPKQRKRPPDYGDRKRVEKEKMKRARREKRSK